MLFTEQIARKAESSKSSSCLYKTAFAIENKGEYFREMVDGLDHIELPTVIFVRGQR